MRWIAVALALFACTGGEPEPTEPETECTPDGWYVDADRDGFGAGELVQGCAEDRTLATADVDGDCNDDDRAISPDGIETCNGVDDDCDDGIDDADPDDEPTNTRVFFADADGDTFGDATTIVRACDVSPGVVADQTDCDDADEYVFPGAEEICNDLDDDCNDLVDDDAIDASTFYRDLDGDTFGDPTAPVLACEQPLNTSVNDEDCDDTTGAVAPNAPERCNRIDDDCDNFIDDADLDSVPADGTTFFADNDNDGVGDAPVVACVLPAGASELPGDCDDNDPMVRPGATETCDDTIDRNCDGALPTDDNDNDGALSCEDCDDFDPNVVAPRDWFLDVDGDGYGDGAPVNACLPPADHVGLDGDCDDNDEFVSPLADEVCDVGVDNDCNGVADEADVGTIDLVTLWIDGDSDGYGADGSEADYCTPPANGVALDGDCDDANPSLNPDTEWYADTDSDGLGDPNSVVRSCLQPPDTADNLDDCDDGDGSVGAGESYYRDADGDGFGTDLIDPVQACVAPPGRVADNTDCDDAEPLINPQTQWYADGDMDGFGDATSFTVSCLPPPDTVLDGTDCDDTDPTLGGPVSWYADTDLDGFGDPGVIVSVACVAPAGAVDNPDDCDDGDMDLNPLTPWYEDADGDGFGNVSVVLTQCLQPVGYVADDQDCDDTNTLIEPGRFDFADTVDNDCDTLVDEDVGSETTLAADVQLVVNARCGGCHTGGSSGGLTMGTNNVWASTVNVPSSQLPSMDRIEPGDPDNSYIWRKIEGTQSVGSQMPLGGMLNANQRAVWETWILEGAVQ